VSQSAVPKAARARDGGALGRITARTTTSGPSHVTSSTLLIQVTRMPAAR
jgi:hypothetical protein